MAAPTKKPTETAPEEGAVSAPAVESDRVAMVSLRADGTPDQGEGFMTLIDQPDDRA